MNRYRWKQQRIYCEGDSESTAPPSGTGGKCVKVRGNRVKGSWGVQSGADRGTASKRSHLLVLAQECFSAKLRVYFTHHSPSTHKSHQTHSIYNIYSVHLSIFNKWVWVSFSCVSVFVSVSFATYQESTETPAGGLPLKTAVDVGAHVHEEEDAALHSVKILLQHLTWQKFIQTSAVSHKPQHILLKNKDHY